MPILYKKAKQAVDKQYDEMIARGYTPVLNADKQTYSWINKETGAKYYGTDPIGGIDASAGVGDVFKRNRRQRRLMSEKAGAVAKENDLRNRVSVDKGNSSSSASQQSAANPDDNRIKELERRIAELEGRTPVITPPTPPPPPGGEGTGEKVLITVPGHGRMTQEELDKLKKEHPEQFEKPVSTIPQYSMDVGYYTGTKDYTHPYLYVEDSKVKAVKSNLGLTERLGRPTLLNIPYGSDAMRRHAGYGNINLGNETRPRGDKVIALKITKDGKTYHLLPNPDFVERLYRPEDIEALRKDATSSLFYSNLNNDKIFEDVELDGKKYIRIKDDKKMATNKAANSVVATIVPFLLFKGRVGGGRTAVATGEAAASSATNVGKEAAEEVISKSTTGAPTAGGQLEFNFEGGIPKGSYAKPTAGTAEFAGRSTTSNASQMSFNFTEAEKQAAATAARASKSAKLRSNPKIKSAASRAVGKARNANKASTLLEDGGKITFNFVR